MTGSCKVSLERSLGTQTLPPKQSFCAGQSEWTVLSALKICSLIFCRDVAFLVDLIAGFLGRVMETRTSAGLLTLPYPLHPGPLSLPEALPRLPLRDPFRVSLHLDAAACCAPRRPYLPLPLDGALEPAFLRRRNERERQRVRCVNEGYARLRDHLPRELAGKRLSKVETLRAAIGYIRHLQGLLERHPRGQEGAAGPPRRSECNSDGESKASSAPSPCSEPEEGGC